MHLFTLIKSKELNAIEIRENDFAFNCEKTENSISSNRLGSKQEALDTVIT